MILSSLLIAILGLLAAISVLSNSKTAIIAHHPITTKSPRAQRCFDEGWSLLISYNRTDARKHFACAAAADPHAGMAFWGLAMSYGPNINVPMFSGYYAKARAAVVRARAEESNASLGEQAYIEAAAQRYPVHKKDADGTAYAAAMERVANKNRTDLDAQTLYADALIDAYPLYSQRDGSPTTQAIEAVRRLRSVLLKGPHAFANHLLIHALDDSKTPLSAIRSARALDALAVSAGESHLKHMGSHIFVKAGMWQIALHENALAAALDLTEEQSLPNDPEIMTYHRHNVDFWFGAAFMTGDKTQTSRSVYEFRRIGAHERLFYYLRVRDWDAVLHESENAVRTPVGQFARAVAFFEMGRIAESKALTRTLRLAAAAHPHDEDTSMFSLLADARTSQCQDSLPFYENAAKIQRRNSYEDYLVWFYPVSQWYGETLLQIGKPRAARHVLTDLLAWDVNDARALEDRAQAEERIGDHFDASADRAAYQKVWLGSRRPTLEVICAR